MKNLKISLTTIVFAIILTISTGVFAAHSVGEVDPENKITMPDVLTNGVGTVKGVSGTVEFQFVEITEAKYSEIKKLEAMYELEEVYVRYSENMLDQTLTNEYKAACQKYESTYGKVSDVITRYGSELPLEQCKSEWIEALTEYKENAWTTSTSNKIALDLSTFTGTKYCIAWIKADNVYDAEVYKVTGTKQEEKKDEDKKDDEKKTEPKTDPDEKKDNTKTEPKTDPDEKKDNTKTEPKTIEKGKTDGSSTSKELPYTGASDVVIGIIAVISIAGAVSYIKYRKIK